MIIKTNTYTTIIKGAFSFTNGSIILNIHVYICIIRYNQVVDILFFKLKNHKSNQLIIFKLYYL